MTSLYRLYGEADHLLYIGIADHWPRRWSEHAHAKPWWETVRRTTIEHFATRTEALSAEKTAIETEHPTHNVVHNGGTKHNGTRNIDVMGTCPQCNLNSIYDRSQDRFFHADGTDNRECWLGMVKGLPTGPLWTSSGNQSPNHTEGVIGKFIHVIKDELPNMQGEIIAEVQPGVFQVRWYSCWDGTPNKSTLHPIGDMAAWHFYDDAGTWRFYMDQAMKTRDLKTERERLDVKEDIF